MGHQLRRELLSLLLLTLALYDAIRAQDCCSVNLKVPLDCFNIMTVNGTGNITDHGCSFLRGPAHGRVLYKEREAMIVCDEGYELVGSSSINCSYGEWLGEVPICREVCTEDQLEPIQNGTVEIIGGIRARYTCEIGFTLIGSFERFCDDGVWTGSPPECIPVIVDQGEEVQIGINPRMTAASGVFEILGPEILITHCNSTLILNYRTTGNGTIRADLLLLDISENGTEDLINEPIASESASVDVLKSNTAFVCLPLVCGNDQNVSIGRVKIIVNVSDGVVEVSDVDFQDNTFCGDTLGDQPTRRRQNIDPPADCGNGTSMCDDSTKSGDCGFRDTGCGTTSFEVTLTDPDGVDDFLVPLQKSRTTDDCEMLVCIACLTNSGFVVNGSNSSNSNITGSSRRRNSTYQHTFGKALCLTPIGNNVAFAEKQHTPSVTKGPDNEYLSFSFDMREGGLHELSVYVLCQGQPSRIQLGIQGTVFKETHYHGRGRSGTVYLQLHKPIKDMESSLGFTCDKFSVVFQGLGLFRKVCVSNIFYLGRFDAFVCGHQEVFNLTGSDRDELRAPASWQEKGGDLCLTPVGDDVAFDEIKHPYRAAVTKGLNNEYFSFSFDMCRGGLHELSVYVLCQGQPSRIQLGIQGTVFKETHYHRRGRSDTVCLQLRKAIKDMESTLGFTCGKFSVLFQGFGLFRQMCISNINFLNKREVGKTHNCRRVDNE